MTVADTNVASELMRPAPWERVLDWVREQPVEDMYTSAITVAEIRYGIERLPEGARKVDLRAAAIDVFRAFADRVLAFDAAAAEQYSLIVSRLERLAIPLEGFDAQIAAICRLHGAALATRNVADFRETGIAVINPWDRRT
jgi:predicted nucleic acid-binding protein